MRLPVERCRARARRYPVRCVNSTALRNIGIVLLLALDGTAAGIGIALASLATVPTLAGLGMWLSGFVSRRARAGKPFA